MQNTKITYSVNAQPYVTELDLKLAFVPQNTIEFLKTAMPQTRNGETGTGEQATGADQGTVLDFDAFLDDAFAA